MRLKNRALDRLRRDPSPVAVWAVEDTSAQIMWGYLPEGEVRLTSNGADAAIDHPGGAGGLTIEGLTPGCNNRIRLTSTAGEMLLTATTLATIGGAVLARVATVSDIHLIENSWGALKTMGEIEPDLDPYSLRCGRSAITEAQAWGPDHLVIKGDAAQHRSQESFTALGNLVDEFMDLPMSLLLGNHDVNRYSSVEIPETVGRRRLRYVTTVDSRPVVEASIIEINTALPGHNAGSLDGRIGPALDRLKAGRPTLIFLHHHLHEYRVARYWPLGVPQSQADTLLTGIGRITDRCVVSSGHTHHNAARVFPGARGPFPVTEVASTKDWPGVWAGYTVYEGGIRQVVKRIEAPEAARWNEYSRHAVLGLWSRWSPGPLDQRCFNHIWRDAQ